MRECPCVHLLGNADGGLEKQTRVIRSVDQSSVGAAGLREAAVVWRGQEGLPVTQGVESGLKGEPGFLDFDLVGLLVMYVNLLGLIL